MINVFKINIKEDVDYKDKDIREKVREEFLKKCYLCEGKPIQNFEIDHFYPQNSYPNLINRYENLFFICSKCNKIRPKSINSSKEKEVLNNCKDDVENLINLDINLNDCKKAIFKVNYTNDTYLNQKIDNTISLLEKIYNGKNTSSEAYKCLQDDIVENIVSFKSELEMYEKDYKGTRFEKRFKNRILKELDRSSIYSGFKKTAFKNMKIKL